MPPSRSFDDPTLPRRFTATPYVIDSPTAVYRIFDGTDRLLYVGMGVNPMIRLESHTTKPWWAKVARVDVQWFPNRIEADAAERHAIETEHPQHNGTYSVRNPPVVQPVVVTDNAEAKLTIEAAGRFLDMPGSAVKRSVDLGFLVPVFRLPPGAKRGRRLFSEAALEEFRRRWKAGDFDLVIPEDEAKQSA